MKNRLSFLARYLLAFLRWALLAVVVGAVCGVAGGLFARCVGLSTRLFGENGWLLYLLPVGGLAIVALYRLLHLPASIGTDTVFQSVRTQEKVPVLLAPAIFLSTAVTHLLGGSAGREGAALQLGGSLGAAVGDLLRPRKDDRRITELCGMAAVFSALFGTPFTAAIFVLEVVEVGAFNYRALMPCALSAVAAKGFAALVGAEAEAFPLASALVPCGTVQLLQALGLGALCAGVAALFCLAMHLSHRYAKKWIPNDWLRAVAGGAVVIALTTILGTRDYNGGGMAVILRALQGKASPVAFLLKIVFTAICLSCGFKGGEIVPSFFVGSTFGCFAAGLLGLDPAVGAALGLACVFCGVTNAPVASLLLGIELFGTEYLPLLGVALAATFMLSGKISLYHSQKFTHPKLGEGYDGD